MSLSDDPSPSGKRVAKSFRQKISHIGRAKPEKRLQGFGMNKK